MSTGMNRWCGQQAGRPRVRVAVQPVHALSAIARAGRPRTRASETAARDHRDASGQPQTIEIPRPRAGDARSVLIRVLTYNASFFPRLREMRDMIASLDADIICLQEVLLAARRREPRNQAEWLAGELGYHYVSNPNWQRYRGIGGDVILTRTPLADVEVLVDPEGCRFALTAIHECDGMRFALVGAHFLLVPRPLPIGVLLTMSRRAAQMRQAVAWLRAAALPCILAGDFNALPYTPEYRTLSRDLVDCTRVVAMNHRNTRPTLGLPAQLDYIFATTHFRTRACRTVDADFSDHRPVVADLEITCTGVDGRRQVGRR
jgi:endonuclease/exonuclease/phosphatase family metal-dependent hydrolase